MSLRGFFLVVYLLVNTLLFTFLKSSFLIFSTFLLNAISIFILVVYHLYYEKDNSPFISTYIVFNFLFFLVAPIVQITSIIDLEKPIFVNFFPYDERLVVYSNILIFIFNFIFSISYIQFKKLKPKKIKAVKLNKYSALNVFLIFIGSILIFILSFNFVKKDLETPSWLEYKASVAELLIWKKVLFLVPLAGIILAFDYLKKNKKLNSNYLIISLSLIVLIGLLFWFKNPFTEKRNALGPIYLSLIYLFYPKLFSRNVNTISILFFIMVLLFPLSSILTNSDATFSQIINNPSILIMEAKFGGIGKTFSTLHYDAFANITATLGYVSENGLSWGFQLLSALLFFIPRSIWESKPISTGQLIGEDLINNYGFNFSNLSNPMVSEGYINFGIIGVILYALIFAYFINLMLQWFKSDNLIKKIMAFYFAIHLMFLLRGDFTNGYSYYVGTIFGVIFIPKLMSYLVNEIYKIR